MVNAISSVISFGRSIQLKKEKWLIPILGSPKFSMGHDKSVLIE